jgi:hypothetical protein
MKIALWTLALLCFSLSLQANDGVFYASGNTLIPVRETVVRMDKEVLTLLRKGDKVFVTVEFEFFNPGPEKVETVGFVTPPASGDLPENMMQHPQIQDFTVVVNGEPLAFAVFRAEGSGFQLKEDVAQGDDFVYHFPTRFKSGLNKVRHTYSFTASSGVDLAYGIFYRLTTGTMWAGGQIGDFTLRIGMAAGDYFTVPYSFQQDGSPATWQLAGSGRLGTHKATMMDHDFRTVRLSKGQVTFHATNFRPEIDLQVNVYPTFDAVYHWLDGGGAHDFTAVPMLLPPYSLSAEDLEPLSDGQLRLLRNLHYAWYGYVFKDKSLNSYFANFNWYVPNPSLTMSKVPLNSDDKGRIAALLAEEKRRK